MPTFEVECVNRESDTFTLVRVDGRERLYVGLHGKLSVEPQYLASYEVSQELSDLMAAGF